MLFGVVGFAIALTLSIALHELGHLVTAKRFGMKATRYFVGFGPTLWSTRRGETEYGVKALPLGGFVKIVGMTPLEDLDPGEEERAFYRRPARHRAIVLAAGSAMHFVLAFGLFVVTFVGVGVPEQTTTVAEVSQCLVLDGSDRECRPEDPRAPAAVAGLREGDTVLALDGQPVRDWSEDLAERIRGHQAGDTVTLTVRRDGGVLDLPVRVARVDRTDPEGNVRNVGMVGLTPTQENRREALLPGIARSAREMGRMFALTGESIVKLPGTIPDLVRQASGAEERTPDGATSLIGVGRVAGQATKAGEFADFLGLIVAVNIFVGVFNLLPLMPLDGGHLAILGFESARSRLARLLRRPDPGRVDLRKLLPATYMFVFLLVGLQLLVLYADIANPLSDPFGG